MDLVKFCFSQCRLDCVTKICSRGSCDVSIMLVEKPVSSMGHLQGKHAGPLRHQRLACYLERKYYFSVYSVLVRRTGLLWWMCGIPAVSCLGSFGLSHHRWCTLRGTAWCWDHRLGSHPAAHSGTDRVRLIVFGAWYRSSKASSPFSDLICFFLFCWLLTRWKIILFF